MLPLFPKPLSQLRGDARQLVEHTERHHDHLGRLVESAEQDLHQAQTAAAATSTDSEEVRSLLSGNVWKSASGLATVRRLCVSAREQHAAASQLLADLDGDDLAEERRFNSVLVVDDLDDVRELVACVLKDAGFVVRTAANGLEALLAAHEMRPSVIVMDVTMPVLDGIEATRLIKAGESTRDARVIAYTANPSLDEAVAQKLFAAVLRKPAHPALVVATVQQFARL